MPRPVTTRFRPLLAVPFILGLGLATRLTAQQQVVVPAFAATEEGNSIHAYPLSYTQARMQILVDATELGQLRVISSIALRPDGGGTTSSYAATNVPLKLSLYQVQASAGLMSTTFASNIGASTGITVFNGRLNLPAFSVQYPLPNPWAVKVSFQAPFALAPQQGNLLVDWESTDPTYVFSRYNVDAVSYPQSAGSLVTRVFRDTSCTNLRADTHAISLTRSTGVIGGQIDVTSTPVVGGSGKLDIVLLLIGASNKTAFGNVPLPQALGASQPGCSLAIDPLLVLPASPAIPLPQDPTLAGVQLFFQGFAGDSSTGDWVLSADAWSLRILDNPPKAQGFQCNFLARYTNQTSGSMSNGFFYVPVLRLN